MVVCYFLFCVKFRLEERPNSVPCVLWPLLPFLHQLSSEGDPGTLVAFKMNGEIVVLLPEKHELPGSNHPLF